MDFKEFRKELMKDPSFRKEYEDQELSFRIAEMVMKARIGAGMTQQELAEKMGTKQPSIARVENANSLPSLNFLKKMAKALDMSFTLPGFISKTETIEGVWGKPTTDIVKIADNVIASQNTLSLINKTNR